MFTLMMSEIALVAGGCQCYCLQNFHWNGYNDQVVTSYWLGEKKDGSACKVSCITENPFWGHHIGPNNDRLDYYDSACRNVTNT